MEQLDLWDFLSKKFIIFNSQKIALMNKLYTIILSLTIGVLFANAQCVDNGNYWNESWVSCSTSTNPNPARGVSHWILYEFHENQSIDTSYVWNANRTGESGWGARDVVVDYSADGTTWTELGNYTFPQAPETSSYQGFLGPIFGGVSVNKILITILNNHDGNTCASLAEVQFKINCSNTWYEDADNDGLGNQMVMIEQCEQPVGYVSNSDDRCDNGALGWEDVMTLFVDNGCTGCHGGASPTMGLDLTSYASYVAGGNQCNDLTLGTKIVDIITMGASCGTDNVPAMNGYVGGAFDATELQILQDWINGGAPELCEDYCFGGCTANVQFKLFLEGPYDAGTGEMVTTLNSSNLIPLTQPFSTAPYNYLGSESVLAIPSADIVDWILVQARDKDNFSTVIESRACFLLKDGTLMDIDGTTGVNFSTLDSSVRYRFAFYHKSHLGVLTSSDVDVPTTSIYDMTSSQTMAEGVQQTKLVSSVYALYGGDYDNNGIINNQDFNLWKLNAATINAYMFWDVDANGVSNNQDFNAWNINRSKVGDLSIQLP